MDSPSHDSSLQGRLENEGGLIGSYRLCERLGEGGFGTVWRAEQTEPVRREVALKVIKRGLDTKEVLRRFKQERQALATLDHPGIAKLLDAGVTPDGRPWFAMELVKGAPITRWCEAHALSILERLGLFQQVCHAVHHAHQKGIIHRDLKPTNVLVSSVDSRPVPKVIDFGIAKLTQTDATASLLTLDGQLLGTPCYMSPEQTEGSASIDTRSDVYSLGVLLYELLTGALPIDAGTVGTQDADEIKRAIRERAPERPSTRSRRRTAAQSQPVTESNAPGQRIAADLDWITLRALEKEPERRYQTASEFAADVQRHLESLPVLACSPGWSYTASRWLKRHRKAISATFLGAGVTTALLMTGLHLANQPKEPAGLELAADGSHTNSLGMKFVPVPDTDVMFCIHETRFRDFAAYAAEMPGAKGSWNDNGSLDYDVPLKDRRNHPVSRVNWEESQAFCRWLSRKEGKTYRLPTDQEWSYAVGVGKDEKWKPETTPRSALRNPTAYPWGSTWPPPEGAGNYCDETWRQSHLSSSDPSLKGYSDGFALTAPVMSFKPNKLGLYDMGGNVAEWVEDWQDSSKKERVLRGSFWSSYPGEDFKTALLSSTRVVRGYSSGIKNPSYGFRCVLEKAPSGVKPVRSLQPAVKTATKTLPPGKFPLKMTPVEISLGALTNSLGMKFVPVPGTDVKFCIHETRFEDYAAFAAEAPDVNLLWKHQKFDGVDLEGKAEGHPVHKVSWEDAQAFCKWLSQKEGKTYRLPKDREWSFAVGIGEFETWTEDTTPRTVFKPTEYHPWESAWPPPAGAGNYRDETRRKKAPRPNTAYLDGYDDGFAATAPVMSFKPNKLGLYDLGGNVWEWCEDAYDTGLSDRVVRGGSWSTPDALFARSSHRLQKPQTFRDPSYGFRVVLVP